MSLFIQIGDGSFHDFVYFHIYPLSTKIQITVVEQEIAPELERVLDCDVEIAVNEHSLSMELRLAFALALHHRDAAKLWTISSLMEEKAGKPRAQYFIEIAADLFVEAYLPER